MPEFMVLNRDYKSVGAACCDSVDYRTSPHRVIIECSNCRGSIPKFGPCLVARSNAANVCDTVSPFTGAFFMSDTGLTCIVTSSF
jgi:hypothetical protein